MIEKGLVESILDTYEVSQQFKDKLNKIASTRIEEQALTSYNEIYEYLAYLVNNFQTPYEERFFLRLDSPINRDSKNLFHELVGYEDPLLQERKEPQNNNGLSFDKLLEILQPHIDNFYLKLIQQLNSNSYLFNFSPEHVVKNARNIQRRLEKLVDVDTKKIIPVNQEKFIPRKRCYKWFNDEERDRIRELNLTGFNDANISEIIERSWTSVRRHRVSMNLPARSIHTSMSKKKQRESILATMKRLTGGNMNYLATVNKLRSAKLGWPKYQLSEALILYALRENGSMETPEIIKKIGRKKKIENWKPHSISYSRFISCICLLRKFGMIKTVYNPKIVADRRKLPRKYQLTRKAQLHYKRNLNSLN